MVELKIQCDCGQKYKFEVEPVDGRMPFTVQCPSCNLDGTPIANDQLTQILSGVSAPAGVPVAAVGVAAPPPAPPTVRVRLNAPPHAAAPAATGVAAAPVSGPGAAAAQAGSKKPSFGLGILGAAVGTLVGALLYFLVFHYFGLRFKLLAVGVGFLSGLGAELLGRKEGSKELGAIAATFCLVGLVAAQYCVVKLWWNSEADATEPTYEAAVVEAKRVLTAVPTGSDQEIRVYLAKENAEEDEKPAPEEVTTEDVQDFRESELPRMKDLASGKITREQFDKENAVDPAEAAADKAAGEDTFKAAFLLFLLSKFNLVSMAAAAGLAYKACSNA